MGRRDPIGTLGGEQTQPGRERLLIEQARFGGEKMRDFSPQHVIYLIIVANSRVPVRREFDKPIVEGGVHVERRRLVAEFSGHLRGRVSIHRFTFSLLICSTGSAAISRFHCV